MKKLLYFSVSALVITFFLALTSSASASSPILKLIATGVGDKVEINISGASANTNVLLHYNKTNGNSYLQYLGETNSSGTYNTTISTAKYNISPNALIYVSIDKQDSNSLAWPYNVSTSGAIALNQTSVVLPVAQSTNLTVSNASGKVLYLLNNSNPQIANINIIGSQITILANSYGQTVATICALGTTSNCASTYITVQNSGATVLTFSQANLTIASGQNSLVTILNANKSINYSILSNSNPNIISASIAGAIITLDAKGNNGSASLTICSTDMSACGIIKATAGNITSTGLNFSQTAPNLSIGQTLNIILSGGNNYNISSNSNPTAVQASINNTDKLTLIGNKTGSSIITVCSSTGNCGSITATISYTTSGPITLSQNNLWLRIGQAISISISGGSRPYSLLSTNTSNNIFKATLNNNILTMSGLSAGSGNINVCSAGGACTQLAVLVNGESYSKQLSFSNNNLKLDIGDTAKINIYGNGGYYISNTNSQNIALIKLDASTINVSALKAGSANATVCQTGGQCSVLYVAVGSNTTNKPLSFSQNNPIISLGQDLTISLSGGLTNNYYISSNSNPTVVKTSITSSSLKLSGLNKGSSVLVICSATNSCNSLAVAITTASLKPTETTNVNPGNTVLMAVASQSKIIASGNINLILSGIKRTRDLNLEHTTLIKYVDPLLKNFNPQATEINDLTYFIAYGTNDTLKLGAGERAGVIGSYLEAYDKLPNSTGQWSDVLKISLGRWPSEISPSAISQAKLEFIKVYNRPANMNNNIDLNAITVIAYGLRPSKRNSNSERQAIKSFEDVYRHPPVDSLAWNIVRAIAYSGASR